ncbi:MAG: glutathione S-transferase family protein [Betaproteobacteria bacterium]|nr:glutathione S-transferase family protein [Betaproteobacteria bacterium]
MSASTTLKLVIGDRNYSSWSLRPWLAARQAGLPFEEVCIPLRNAGSKVHILKHSPSGKVPCLIHGDTVVWDSLAICEHLAELVPSLWPADRRARSEARSVSAEMHSGFTALRQNMGMDIRASKPFDGRTSAAEADIARIVAIWENCRSRFAAGGHFLFGDFSIADAMYAPVVWRFLTHAVALPAASQAWVEAMLALPAMREWQAGALAEAGPA